MSGILGLAYGSISVDGLPTFIDSSDLKDKSFAFYLHENPDKSFMTLPGYEESAKDGDFQYHNVIEEKYWSLNFTGAAQGSNKIDVTGYKAVIDSGTSVLVGPFDIVNKITANITVSSDCSNLNTLPNISFFLDGIEYALTPADYVLKVSELGQTECVLAVMGSDFPSGFDYFILGDVFMRKYYTYFDKNNNRVGFAAPAAL
jgi:cathepsin D